jgi:hypothetical protein
MRRNVNLVERCQSCVHRCVFPTPGVSLNPDGAEVLMEALKAKLVVSQPLACQMFCFQASISSSGLFVVEKHVDVTQM